MAIEKNVPVKETKRKGWSHLSMVVLWIYYTFRKKTLEEVFLVFEQTAQNPHNSHEHL